MSYISRTNLTTVLRCAFPSSKQLSVRLLTQQNRMAFLGLASERTVANLMLQLVDNDIL